MITAVTVHFNTIELTTCLCSSLRKQHQNCRIIVFDNSTLRPLPEWVIRGFGIEYHDNTNEAIINFYQTFSDLGLEIDPLIKGINDLGSAKHALTIDWLTKNIDCDDFVLFDSDVLLKKPIDFIDNQLVTAGAINQEECEINPSRKPRILPFCQYFNATLIREIGLNYFDPSRILGFSPATRMYDTGTSFYYDILDLPKNQYNLSYDINDYIVHYRRGSWTSASPTKFLQDNKELFWMAC